MLRLPWLLLERGDGLLSALAQLQSKMVCADDKEDTNLDFCKALMAEQRSMGNLPHDASVALAPVKEKHPTMPAGLAHACAL
jgi:hypothetical protein